MSSLEALRWTGALIAWAIFLQAIELSLMPAHGMYRILNKTRAILAFFILVFCGSGAPVPLSLYGLLAVLSWVALWPWLGLFNGGSDAMGMMVMIALYAAGLGLPPEHALLWIACLSALSYFLSGVRKASQQAWWNGRALRDFLKNSRVSVPGWACRFAEGALPRIAGPGVVLFQLAMPALLWSGAAPVALLTGMVFHFLNFLFFGLNRFFWVWMATYPAFYFHCPR
jgi:hypothetical protein